MKAERVKSESSHKYLAVAALGAVILIGGVATVATAVNSPAGRTDAAVQTMITADDVLAAQEAWGKGIVEIGSTFRSGDDYQTRAAQHIESLYAYGHSEVLFKPTLASADQFRESFDEALSYFVSGKISEDKGFAIRPWSNVRFGEQQIVTDSDSAIAMGNYYFTPADSEEEVKVEFTFGYIRDENGELRINLHHSSLPHSS